MTKQEIEERIRKDFTTLSQMASVRDMTNESDEEYLKKVDYYLDHINKLKRELKKKK